MPPTYNASMIAFAHCTTLPSCSIHFCAPHACVTPSLHGSLTCTAAPKDSPLSVSRVPDRLPGAAGTRQAPVYAAALGTSQAAVLHVCSHARWHQCPSLRRHATCMQTSCSTSRAARFTLTSILWSDPLISMTTLARRPAAFTASWQCTRPRRWAPPTRAPPAGSPGTAACTSSG